MQFPAGRQGVPGDGQAYGRVARPDLRQDVFQRPLDGFEVGAKFEVADEQQALAVQGGLHLLVVIAIHAIDHHVHRAPADLADQFGIVRADRHHFTGLAQHALLPTAVAPAVEGIEWPQPERQAVIADAAHH
ncbi:hypothetical protein D3C71_1524250 [compost metagenome]